MLFTLLTFVAVYIFIFMRNICWLRFYKNKAKFDIAKTKNISSTPIYLIIPMLNEQGIALETYNYYTRLLNNTPHRLIIVTTSKEKIEPTTYSLLLEKHTMTPSKNISIINYPNTEGVMAHQLNYAIEYIVKNYSENSWIGIYNADSRIEKETLNYISYSVESKNEIYKYCYQQYSIYPCPKNVKSRSILASAAQWQNRWTLLFELARVQWQLKLKKFLLKLPKSKSNKIIEIVFGKMNYVIGHGLYIHLKTLKLVGGIPTDTINEDAYLGYLLGIYGIEIRPIPFFEISEFTDKFSVFVKQQSVWFNGPFYAFQYFKLSSISIKEESLLEYIFKLLLAIKLFLHAVYWILSPLIMLVLIPVLGSLVWGLWFIFIWLFFTYIYHTGLNYLVYNILIKYFGKNVSPKPSVLCILAYFLHSIGPLFCVFKIICRKNTQKNKYKTERNKI